MSDDNASSGLITGGFVIALISDVPASEWLSRSL